MICIAAFIILLIIWLFTPLMKIFGFKKQAKAINSMFRKSMHCFSKRVTLQACDSNFKDEIKNSILNRLIVRHKKWVKPVSVGIEIMAIAVVLVTVWSILTVVKSGLALWTFGTCNIEKPEACVLSSSESCSIDSVNSDPAVIRWFTEWGDIFEAIPGKFQTLNENELKPEKASFYGENSNPNQQKPIAIDILDPGCVICRHSFVAQKSSGFFDKYNTFLLPYVIEGKFDNSELIAKYIEAVRGIYPENGEKISPEWFLIEKIFTGKDSSNIVWQENFNGAVLKAYSAEKVKAKIVKWLKEAKYSEQQIDYISKRAQSSAVAEKLKENKKLVEETLRTKKIPTLIFDGKRHDGLFKSEK